MADEFEDFNKDNADNFMASARHSFAVTPHDTNALSFVTRGVYVGVGGDISMMLDADEAAVLWKNVPTGSILPVRATKILATNTTATNILGLY